MVRVFLIPLLVARRRDSDLAFFMQNMEAHVQLLRNVGAENERVQNKNVVVVVEMEDRDSNVRKMDGRHPT